MLVKCLTKFTTFFHSVPQNTNFAIAYNIGTFVFNTDVTVSQPKIKSWKISTKMEHIPPPLSLSLSINNTSSRLKLYRKIPKEIFWKFSKHWNLISYTTTTDTTHVHVPVTHIGRPSKQLGCLHFYTILVVYNS